MLEIFFFQKLYRDCRQNKKVIIEETNAKNFAHRPFNNKLEPYNGKSQNVCQALGKKNFLAKKK